ncbi:HAD-IIA family hydrolase [Sphingobacterium thalpophilum]|uniref:HAD-IIA family hydrolase n=1 Tax=Sphingobacterium thalpophilum TaxID=259 RepID=UPI0037DA748D
MSYITDCSKVPGSVFEALQQIKHLILDLDGTVYTGNTIFPYTIDFLKTLRRLDISYSFFTNNSSKGSFDHLSKLRAMGIHVSPEGLFTSSDATIHFILTHYPHWKRLFILGTPSLVAQFEKRGFIILDETSEEDPDALIVSFDTTLTYAKLCRAAWWAKQGKPYLSTNPDLVCPSDQDVVLVDCGAICQSIEAATGRRPDRILGKPHPEILRELINSKKMQVNQVAIVGDRIYTDMLAAHNVGSFSILVLSGETDLVDLSGSSIKIDVIVPSVKELGQLMTYVHEHEIHCK